MFEHDDIEVRLVDLARRLRERTESGRAAWRRTDRVGRYLYVARTGSVTIERNPLGTYVLRVLDRLGNEVENLSAAMSPLHGGIVPADALGTLLALFEAAEKSARRSSGLVDELIAEIG